MSTIEIKEELHNIINNSDSSFVKEIYEMILKYKKTKQNNLNTFTQEELLNRAKKSNNDYVSGKYKTQEQLKKDALNW